MAPSLPTRWLLRVLAWRSGQVQAIQDLHALRGVSRLAVLFIATILLPALLLSYMALSSSRTEELTVDAELRNRADVVIQQMSRELSGIFFRFEQVTLERLRRGDSPLENLGEMSPYLRAAYRIDKSGGLAAPYLLPEADPPPPSAAYRSARRSALRAEAEAKPELALRAWSQAVQRARQGPATASAQLGRARALLAGGHDQAAADAFTALTSGYDVVRDAQGYRLHDVAALGRAELANRHTPGAGDAALRALVGQVLASRWRVGAPTDAAIVRRALRQMEDRADPDWSAEARAKLAKRTDALAWTEAIRSEIELLGPASFGQMGEFRYQAQPGSPSLWATVRGEHHYAFSFARWVVANDLAAAARRLNEVDADLKTLLIGPGDVVPEEALATRTLGPWMHALTVVVVPANPEGLALRKQQRHRARLGIIVLSVLMVTVGVFISAQVIGREMESARMKTDFAANVSHELRSPITQIRLKGEALQLDLTYDDDDRRAHYDAIVREAERLSRLVDNILDFSAIERGVKKYSLRPDDLARVIYSTLDSISSAVDEAKLELELDLPDDLPPLWIDREAIAQVLINLVSNAIKYGNDGGWIGVKARVGLDGVDLSVADRGMGIPEADLPHVFNDFYRSSDPNVRRRKGTGIGLSIVRYIVDAHHGSITVESAPGKGTTFTITFPTSPPEGNGDA